MLRRKQAPRLEGGDFLLAVLRAGLAHPYLLLLLFGFFFISPEDRRKEKEP